MLWLWINKGSFTVFFDRLDQVEGGIGCQQTRHNPFNGNGVFVYQVFSLLHEQRFGVYPGWWCGKSFLCMFVGF